MKLYNMLSRTIEPFEATEENVSIYVCGITPYDTTHLGHAFTYTCADILIRYLENQGNQVQYVQNVTDIDDDILRKAKEVGEDWRALGNRWTAHFIRDMQLLNVSPPDHYPRATDVIPEIIQMVQKLLQVGMAYEVEGNVYFDVAAWPEYGKLSGLPHEQMLPVANEHGNNPDDPHKRYPLDFVLWQAQTPGEPAWDSPWGAGRPGWHIECSTMATRFLGATIDIHSGGADLIFPHHESEIAQAEPVTGEKPFVRFWVHTAMVHYESEKMSKSLGNLVMVRDLLEEWPADALRFYLGSHHYRQAWSYEANQLAQAAQRVERLRAAVLVSGGNGAPLDPRPAQQQFDEAIAQDLDTPAATLVLDALGEQILAAARAGRQVEAAQKVLRRLSGIFGLRLDREEVEAQVLAGWNRHLERFEAESITF
jgi:L-cysteine:1D-myo-inositol 2-amino-2-deoxy-alpha-D-glucopyranoside ligase